MGKKKRINRRTLDLPDELIWQILTKLPVKSLLRFKCVSKSWCSIISSKEFITAHLKNRSTSTDLTHNKVILFLCEIDKDINESSNAFSIKTREDLVIEDLNHHPLFYWSRFNSYVKILGSCNGLVLVDLVLMWNSKVLWNPSTREVKEIPCPPYVAELGYWKHFKHGFGYDDATDDHKVVCIFSTRRPFRTLIYSCRANSWREIENFPNVGQFSDSGQLVNGRLHWLAEEGGDWHIVSLSLVDEKYEIFPWLENVLRLPNFRQTLGNLGGYLSLVIDDGFGDTDVWVMKKYGEVKSWTKIWMPSDFGIPRSYNSSAKPLWLMNNGDIAVAFSGASGSAVAVYNVESKVCKSRLDIVDSKIVEPNFFVESLVSPFGNEQSHQ